MLLFIGLGLYDAYDISLKGFLSIRNADCVYLEGYTSKLMGTTVKELETLFGKPIIVLNREDVEQQPDELLKQAKTKCVAFLIGGDPMISTTHADLRLRAKTQKIDTKIIHGASISSAVCGLTGLQNYRFGKSCSIPYPSHNWNPTAPFETISTNLAMDFHTLVYLDISGERYMTVREGISIIETMAIKKKLPMPPLMIGIARAGSDDQVVIAGTPIKLKDFDFGPPLHILVIPAKLHPIELEYLKVFGNYECQ